MHYMSKHKPYNISAIAHVNNTRSFCLHSTHAPAPTATAFAATIPAATAISATAPSATYFTKWMDEKRKGSVIKPSAKLNINISMKNT